MKHNEKLNFLNKSYFNKIYLVLVLSFTYMMADICFYQLFLILLLSFTLLIDIFKETLKKL